MSRTILFLSFLLVLSCDVAEGPLPPAPQPDPEPHPPGEEPQFCEAVETLQAARIVSRKIDNRIIGGKPARPLPWLASIQDAGWPYCAASLIKHTGDRSWLVGAQHCQYQPGDTVILNRPDLRIAAEGSVVTSVKRTLNHLTSDIALIEIDRVDIEPVPIAEPDEVWAVAAGYGTTSYGGQPSPRLLEVEVPIVSFEQCKAAYGSGVQEWEVCAGDGGLDSCNGDSGGPLFTLDGIVGVTSRGFKCGEEGFPGIYTTVKAHGDWINSCAK